jgi:hypothetical protein
MADYETRFEDAVSRIEYLLGLLMEHNFDRIKQMLGASK